MNYHKLLEKYFQAESSLEEEELLREYMLSEDVEEDLKKYQPLFRFFEEEKESELDRHFDSKLQTSLSRKTKTIQMPVWRKYILRVAAVAAVLVGLFLIILQTQHKQQAIDWSKYEVTDEQQAYEETMKALGILADKLGKGAKTTTRSMSETRKVAKYLN